MINETTHDPVYQYRFFDTRIASPTSGEWSLWRNCSKDVHDIFSEDLEKENNDTCILYQVRVLNVVTSYPTDEYIAEHYKVQT